MLNNHFHIWLTSEHVAKHGWVPCSEHWGQLSKKRIKKEPWPNIMACSAYAWTCIMKLLYVYCVCVCVSWCCKAYPSMKPLCPCLDVLRRIHQWNLWHHGLVILSYVLTSLRSGRPRPILQWSSGCRLSLSQRDFWRQYFRHRPDRTWYSIGALLQCNNSKNMNNGSDNSRNSHRTVMLYRLTVSLFVCNLPVLSPSQYETCIPPLTILHSAAEQTNILQNTVKIKWKLLFD